MLSPSQDPPQDHTHTNPYLSTLTIPPPESLLPGSQYQYMAHYYANMHNQNGLQALSPYSTTTTTTIEPPSLYDRYKDSGMMNQMGPLLLSLVCSKYQDLPSKSNPLLAIRLYVESFPNNESWSWFTAHFDTDSTCCFPGLVNVVQSLQHRFSFALCRCSTSKRPECGGCYNRHPS